MELSRQLHAAPALSPATVPVAPRTNLYALEMKKMSKRLGNRVCIHRSFIPYWMSQEHVDGIEQRTF